MTIYLPKYRYLLVCMLICNIYLLPLFGQAEGSDYLYQPIEQKQFDDGEWQSLQKSLDYSKKKPESQPEPQPETEKSEPFSFPEFSTPPVLARMFKILALMILIGLLSWLMYQLIKKTTLTIDTESDHGLDNNQAKGLVSLEKLAEQLDKHNINPYIEQAEKDRNYPLAVRLHFLALLKKLYKKELIHWKKNYTNNIYLNQMREKNNFAQFKMLTSAYERIWYGDRHPNFEEYEELREQFLAFRLDPS